MIDAMKQALEALEVISASNGTDDFQTVATNARYALRQAIEQAEKQEPVARFNWNEAKFEWLTEYSYEKHHMKPLYLAPPKREWVGLTTEEAAICWTNSEVQSWKNIEAKLKEKNT